VTQAVRDLDVLLLTDKSGKASNSSDKTYLKSLKAFFASQARAPWLIQHDSELSNEMFRLLAENLSGKAKRIFAKLRDQSLLRHFVWEKASGSNSRLFNTEGSAVSIHLATPFLHEVAYFAAIGAYLASVFLVLKLGKDWASKRKTE